MTIFSKIIAGEIPSYKVAENPDFYAFLDIRPLVKGHVLVVPKIETDYLFDLDDKTLGDMMIFSKRVAKAIKNAIPCKRIGLTVIGMEVPHAHIHLVPLTKESDIFFDNPKQIFTSEEFKEIAEAIEANFK